MDAISGIKIVKDETIDSLPYPDYIKKIIRDINNLAQYGHTDDKKHTLVCSEGYQRIMADLCMISMKYREALYD